MSQTNAEGLHQGRHVSGRLRRRRVRRERAALPHLGRHFDIKCRKRIHENHHRLPASDEIDDSGHLGFGESVRQNRDQRVQIVRVLLPLGQFLNEVLFAQFEHDRPVLPVLLRLEIKAPKHFDLARHHANLLLFRVGNRANRAHQLVLDRQAGIKERDDELLRAPIEDNAKKYLVGAARTLFGWRDRPRLNAKSLLGLARLGRVLFGLDNPRVDAALS